MSTDDDFDLDGGIPGVSDDDANWQGAPVSAEWIRQHRKRLLMEKAEREAQGLVESMELFQRLAEQALGMSPAALMLVPGELVPRIEAPKVERAVVTGTRNVPELHARHVYDVDPIECEALHEVRTFISAAQSTFLVLSGGVGTRKTGSACWALTQRPGMFLTADDLADKRYRDEWHDIKRKGLLVLDELGAEHSNEKGWLGSVVDSLLNYRYSQCLKTIITCNLTAPEFKLRYGDRLADRIRECGSFVRIAGESVRRR